MFAKRLSCWNTEFITVTGFGSRRRPYDNEKIFNLRGTKSIKKKNHFIIFSRYRMTIDVAVVILMPITVCTDYGNPYGREVPVSNIRAWENIGCTGERKVGYLNKITVSRYWNEWPIGMSVENSFFLSYSRSIVEMFTLRRYRRFWKQTKKKKQLLS